MLSRRVNSIQYAFECICLACASKTAKEKHLTDVTLCVTPFDPLNMEVTEAKQHLFHTWGLRQNDGIHDPYENLRTSLRTDANRECVPQSRWVRLVNVRATRKHKSRNNESWNGSELI